jgi:hypothetical protein
MIPPGAPHLDGGHEDRTCATDLAVSLNAPAIQRLVQPGWRHGTVLLTPSEAGHCLDAAVGGDDALPAAEGIVAPAGYGHLADVVGRC